MIMFEGKCEYTLKNLQGLMRAVQSRSESAVYLAGSAYFIILGILTLLWGWSFLISFLWFFVAALLIASWIMLPKQAAKRAFLQNQIMYGKEVTMRYVFYEEYFEVFNTQSGGKANLKYSDIVETGETFGLITITAKNGIHFMADKQEWTQDALDKFKVFIRDRTPVGKCRFYEANIGMIGK